MKANIKEAPMTRFMYQMAESVRCEDHYQVSVSRCDKTSSFVGSDYAELSGRLAVDDKLELAFQMGKQHDDHDYMPSGE